MVALQPDDVAVCAVQNLSPLVPCGQALSHGRARGSRRQRTLRMLGLVKLELRSLSSSRSAKVSTKKSASRVEI